MYNSLVENISVQFTRKIDLGVTIDLKDFLKEDNLIKEYDIKTVENTYIVNIQLVEFDSSKVKEVFYPLMRFVDYDTTFYTHEVNSEGIIYYLLSMSLDEKLGFYFKIIFHK
jgi:hypothetical protein